MANKVGVVRARVDLTLWAQVLEAVEASGGPLSEWLRQACAEKVARDQKLAVQQQDAAEIDRLREQRRVEAMDRMRRNTGGAA